MKTKPFSAPPAKPQKPWFWRLVLAGFLLAQLAPQIRVSIHDEGGWKWPAFKIGYSGEVAQNEQSLIELNYWKRAAQENREQVDELSWRNNEQGGRIDNLLALIDRINRKNKQGQP